MTTVSNKNIKQYNCFKNKKCSEMFKKWSEKFLKQQETQTFEW